MCLSLIGYDLIQHLNFSVLCHDVGCGWKIQTLENFNLKSFLSFKNTFKLWKCLEGDEDGDAFFLIFWVSFPGDIF